jgi:uncharacterized protein YecE (DUF72 family)
MLGEARIGTSGFAQPELVAGPGPELLSRYSQLLGAIEVGSSFRRPPGPEAVASWASCVPPGFQFALKLPRQISHELSLSRAALRSLGGFLEAVAELGPHLGPLLVQLPPTFSLDTRALGEFLRGVPRGPRLAFEFRHPSWLQAATLRLLSAHEAALVVCEQLGDSLRMELTADFAYVRIRADDDRPSVWEDWAARLAALTRRGIDVYAFVHHDRRGVAVDRARRLASLLRTEETSAGQALLT